MNNINIIDLMILQWNVLCGYCYLVHFYCHVYYPVSEASSGVMVYAYKIPQSWIRFDSHLDRALIHRTYKCVAIKTLHRASNPLRFVVSTIDLGKTHNATDEKGASKGLMCVLCVSCPTFLPPNWLRKCMIFFCNNDRLIANFGHNQRANI